MPCARPGKSSIEPRGRSGSRASASNTHAASSPENPGRFSLSTGNVDRDERLRTGEFFWVEKYPTLTFQSTQTTAIDSTHFKVGGDLTIRDITKPVILDAEPGPPASSPWRS